MSVQALLALGVLLLALAGVGKLFKLWAARRSPELPGVIAILTGLAAGGCLLGALIYRVPRSRPSTPGEALLAAIADGLAQGVVAGLLIMAAGFLFLLALAMGLGTLFGAQDFAARNPGRRE